MAQHPILKAAGLYLDSSQLSEAPEGAMSQADNVVIDRPGMVETRRGFEAYSPDPGVTFQALAPYAGSLVGLHAVEGASGGVLSGGAWSGLGTVNNAQGRYRPGVVQANSSLYVATSTGIQKLNSLSGSLLQAGLNSPLEMTATTTAGTAPWLANGDSVAYRILLCWTDPNGFLIQSAPCGRLLVTNSAGSTQSVSVQFQVPANVPSGAFVQLYRTSAAAGGADPGEEMGLVYQADLSSVTEGALFTITDETPDALIGAIGYFCPSQEGLAQENEMPPVAACIANFRETMFFGNCASRQRLTLTILSVSGAGMQVGDTVTIAGALMYQASTVEDLGHRKFQLYTFGTASENIETTARSLVNLINQEYTSNGSVYASYISGPNDLPGQIEIYAKNMGAASFAATCGALSQTVNQLSRTGSTVTATTVSPHGYAVGATVTLASGSPDADYPVGDKVIASIPTTTTFTYDESGAATTVSVSYTATHTNPADAWSPNLPTSGTSVSSSNDAAKNRLFWSKYQQPEAVPLLNFQDIGSAYCAILALAPTRDSLIIVKEDGIWRLTGEAGAFRVDPLDPTVKVIAPDSVASVGNRVFALADQGVVAISDTGVSVVSFGRIDSALKSIRVAAPSNIGQVTFGVGYEAERRYILFLPSADTGACTQAYVYNVFTDAWTKWTLGGYSGCINPADGKLYIANGTVTGVHLITERKDFASTDFQDWNSGNAISVACTWLPTAAGDLAAKQFQGLGVLLEGAAPATMPTATFQSETGTSAAVTLGPATSTNPGTLYTWVPMAQQRAGQLVVSIAHSAAQQALKVLGLVLQFRPLGERRSVR